MNRLRRHPLFFAVLILSGVFALGEAWCLVAQIRAAGRAQRRLGLKRREASALAGVEPAPSEQNAKTIASDLGAARQALAAMRGALTARSGARDADPAPARPADAYFDIAEYVERMRDQAGQSAVTVRPDERFGFADYANTGPEPDLIPTVHRERVVAEYLLATLFAARPSQLIGLQRERPVEPAAATRGEGRGSADTFDVPSSVTARLPGFVDATGFRVSFVGTTAVLRDWLNRLATFERPVVVRSVEVERAADAGTTADDGPEAARPLVPRARSRFTVTLEAINLPPPPAAPGA